ncbi:MAG TPA: sugar phosphate isomerase/epimerase family protein [Desulfobacterales bacterium]|jgi:sugar phosphate isomerase/epimerase|nr:sugar phosphate isomerase/epimerase family protein [Desulfobacterales bacterium]
MIFGYSTNAFVKFPLSESLEKIADLGFEGVEIMGDRPHLYPPDFGAREIAELQAILRRRGLRVTNINSFTLFAVGDTYLPSWIEPEAERRQIRIRHTRDSLRMAAALGCRNISVPPGGPLGDLSRKAALARFHAGLEQVIPLAEELDVRVLVEPEPGLMLENTAEFREFIRDVRSPLVGINFDIGHFFCAGEDPRAAFEELFQWVGHMHIEDIAPDRRHQHLIAGQGAIAFRSVFEAMARLGYAHDISLELYPYVDMPEQAGRESRDFLLPLFREAGLL